MYNKTDKNTGIMITKRITSALTKANISFTIENRYNEFNKEIFFMFNGLEFEADITNGSALAFINEKGRVYRTLKSILK